MHFNLWSFKTGGLSCQWSFQTGSLYIPGILVTNIYSGPSLKGHSGKDTLYKGHKFLAESAMIECGAPSHQRTPL